MVKVLGNLAFLLLLYGALMLDPNTSAFRSELSHRIALEQIGMYGILTLAAGQLILTGGIDLSIGSTVALTSTFFCWLLINKDLSPVVAAPLVLLLGMAIGLFHGVMIAVVRIQAFVVTLCGLFFYRSAARWLAREEPMGLGGRYGELSDFFNSSIFHIPVYFLILTGLLVVASVFLHFSVYGRYFFAIGSNEKAAAYCGIPTIRYKIVSYVICSTLTSLFAMLFVFWLGSVQPTTTGNFFELYAIAGAVMGGISLRGGEGNTLGMFLGTCIIWLLPVYVFYKGVPESLREAIFGGALLFGAFLDEMLRRSYGYRRA
jgi:ribose transport system permease protein